MDPLATYRAAHVKALMVPDIYVVIPSEGVKNAA